MIRNEELLAYLETISSTVVHELKPDLQSGQARKSADFLIQMLNRMVAQVRDAETIAAAELAEWEALRRELPLAWRGDDDSTMINTHEGFARLEAEMASIQRRLTEATASHDLIHGLADPDSAQTRWLLQAIDTTHRLWEAIEDSVQPPVAQSPQDGGALDLEPLRAKLNAYLRQRFAQLPDDVVCACRVASGGSTKLTVLFSLRPNTVLPTHLVLRQDMATSVTGARVTDEFPVVERLHGLGLRVPRPILIEPDAGILGGPFMIMTEIEDAVPAGAYFAKERAQAPCTIGGEFARDAAVELARLHRLTETTQRDPAQTSTRTAALDAAHQRWMAMDKPALSTVMDMGFAWLKAHPLGDDRPRCLIHGDYGVHNMMARDGHLAGVLDWELAQDDDPAIDLAECRMLMVEDTLPWEEFVTAYLAAGGDPRACDPAAVAYYSVWMFVAKFGVMTAEAWNYYIKGLRRDSNMASIAGHSMDRVMQYAARALKMAVAQA